MNWFPTSERARLRRAERRVHELEQRVRHLNKFVYQLAGAVRQTSEIEVHNARTFERIAQAIEVFSQAPAAVTMSFGPPIEEEQEVPSPNQSLNK